MGIFQLIDNIGHVLIVLAAFIFIAVVAILLIRNRHLSQEIDLRKHAEESFRHSDELLRAVINEIPDIFMLKDYKGDFILCNEALAKLYGTTPEAMVGKHDGNFGVPREMAEFFRKNVLEIMDRGDTEIVYEDSRNAETGEIRHYKSIKTPMKSPNGENQILVIAQDITELIENQEKIRSSENLLQGLLETIKEGVWEWHIPSGSVVHNTQWYDTLGVRHGDIEETVEAFLELLHPDDQKAIHERLDKLLDGSSKQYRSEHRMVKPNGQVIWVQDRGRIIERDKDGKPIRMVGSFTDITERVESEKLVRESEARFRALFERMPSGVAVYESIDDGNDFVLKDFNSSAERIDKTSRSELIGRQISDLYHGQQNFPINDVFQRVRKTGDTEFFTGFILQEDGKTRSWRETSVYKLPSGDIVSVYDDVSERKKAEQEKERMQRELQQAHKMEALGQLTGGIAHDFNNILGIVMGYTNIVLDRFGNKIPAKASDYLETSLKASQRAQDLVAKMMVFSHRRHLEPQSLQLGPVLEENFKMLRSMLPSSIKMELQCEKNLPNVLLDPSQIQQMLMNLCINAKDAMNETGEIKIGLHLHNNVDAECADCHQWIKGDWVELIVQDNGCGMTAEICEHIFEPFFTTKDVGKGTGMGMAVLHGILTEHGGHTTVETEVGKGTTFHLLFPPIYGQQQTFDEIGTTDQALPKGKGQQILVVDDEPDLADYIGDLLDLHGYQVTIETDSIKALQLLRDNPSAYALLVTDHTMPEITGLELLKAVKEIQPQMPVIICSGYNEITELNGVEPRGVRFMGKPIDIEKLIRFVGELTQIYEQSLEIQRPEGR